MRKKQARLAALLALVLGGMLPLVGCADGPAEQAGERIDNAARETRDVVNPPGGPAEAAGRKIDDATNAAP